MDTLNRPLRILSQFDLLLTRQIEINVIGRSALALGYRNPRPEYPATMDVDSVIPQNQIEFIERNDDFWNANDRLNQILEKEGLYFTHIFEEKQIILRKNWYEMRVRILKEEFKNIILYRPHTIDLILSKMMRNDYQDMQDIDFLLEHIEPEEYSHLKEAINNPNIPNIPEIVELFQKSKVKLESKISNLMN